MSARPTHDLCVKTGEYTDSTEQTRGRWLRIGTKFVHDDGGESYKLEALPVGLPTWDGWVNAFPRQPKTDPQQPKANPPTPPQRPTTQGARQSPNHRYQAPLQPPNTQQQGPVYEYDDTLPF